MKLFTSLAFRRTFAVFALIFSITYTSSAQCGLTLSVSASATTCVGHDTLVVSGASSAVQIVWQSANSTTTIDSTGGSIDTTFIPTSAGMYVAIVTAPGGCLDTTSATEVDSVVTPSVSISTGHSHTICYGTVITFTAHPINGGNTPAYQWYVSGVPTGTASTFVDSTLHNADSVWVVMVSSAICSSPDTVVSNVIPYVVDSVVTPGITISSVYTGDTICQNTIVTLHAIGVNGGANADYQWQANGVNVGNTATYLATTVHSGDVYDCIITSTASCLTQVKDTSASITFTVMPYPTVAVISSSPTHTVCLGDSTALTATGGSSYVWSTGDTVPTIYSTGGSYTVTATNAYGCTAGSSPLTLAPLAAGVDTIYQTGDSLVSGSSEFYQWYYNGNIISGAIGPVYVPAAAGEYEVAIIDSFGCVAYSPIVTIYASGINTIAQSPQIRMYPNPNAGIFSVEMGDDALHAATITDETGRVVADHISIRRHQQLDLSTLSDGVYYLRIDSGVVKFTVVK